MEYLLALTLALVPTYSIKINFFGLPTNLLMLWVGLFWLIFVGWLIKTKNINQFVKSILVLDKKVLIFISLIFLSGVVGLEYKGIDQNKLGQFIVLIFQPIITFFIAKFIINKKSNTTNLLLITCYLLLASTGIYAVVQYLTLFGLPQIYWGNSVEPKRAVAFFGHPNFYALFVTPILAFLLADLRLKIVNYRKNWFYIASWIVGSIGLFLSLSRAGWLGLLAAIMIYVIVAADKKIRKFIFFLAITGLIIIAVVPNFRYRLLLPFYGEKSAVSRLSLWTTGTKAIKESPIFGLGLTGFSQNWKRLNSDPNLDTHNFPHNIFLNFWVELGLIGLIGQMGFMGLIIFRGLKNTTIPAQAGIQNQNDALKLSLALFLIAILVQGQIDNPYFKNDLAMVFWIILALI